MIQKEESMEKLILKNEIAKHTKPDVLPLQVAMNNGEGPSAFRFGIVRVNNIWEIKKLVEKTDEVGKPLIFKVRNFGKGLYPELLTVLNFYDQQVERLIDYKDQNNCGDNLFYYEQREKLDIVRDYEKEIYEYLFNNGQDYIFGKLTDAQKDKIYSAIRGSKSVKNQNLLSKLNEVIANYTTLEELKDVNKIYKGQRKVLSRFIK